MKIIAETTTLYSPKDGKKHGLTIIPSCTIIDGEVYRDFEETEDKKRITLFSVKRSKRKAVDALINHLKEIGVNENYFVTVSHAGDKEEAQSICAKLKEHFTGAATEIFRLPPSLITHGGPGCIVIQAIHR